MSVFYLVRHGATPSTETLRVCGSSDVALSARGLREMAAVAQFFSDKKLERVFASPLQRARGPAEALAADKAVELSIVPELAEIDFGEWEGRTLADVAVRWPLKFAKVQRPKPEFTFPGGENLRAFQERALSAFAQIRKRTEHAAAVYTHGGVLRMLVGDFNKLTLPQAKNLSFSTGGITTVECNGDVTRVISSNCFAHLTEH
jgi:broad specificity phosphatase PhoE